jgi:hypothetical protein
MYVHVYLSASTLEMYCLQRYSTWRLPRHLGHNHEAQRRRIGQTGSQVPSIARLNRQ